MPAENSISEKIRSPKGRASARPKLKSGGRKVSDIRIEGVKSSASQKRVRSAGPHAASVLASTKESFQRSFHTYDAQRASLQKDKGKFALVSEENIAGVFPTYEAALTQGYKKFGVGKFIVQEVGAEDRVEFLANVRSACPA